MTTAPNERQLGVLTYHTVEPHFDLGITWVTPRQFRQHVELLAQSGFRGVGIGELLHLEGETKAIALTFDDAYQSVYEWAFPCLSEAGWTATVFPIVEYVGRDNRWDGNLFGRRLAHMDWSELRELVDSGWEIGSHGLTHSYLDWLDANRLRRELRGSKAALEDRLGIEVRTFCAPYGRASPRVLREAFEAGYRAVCLLQGGSAGVAHRLDAGWVVQRWAIYRLDSARGVLARLTGGRRRRARLWIQRIVSAANFGGVLVQCGREKGLAILSGFAKIGRGAAG
jgi:peptidoglycan/xylan/chitin deacetylase (PgdA/CDA1 family)